MTASENTPLVSVALVTYNQREFLDQCLRSIIAQDYPALEIIIADDASTDGSADLISRYADRYPDKIVAIIAPQNRGVTVNQAAALAACTGKFIAWMAGDDLMLPGKIAAQVAHLEANPNCTICYHDLELFDSDSGAKIGLMSHFDRQRSGTVATLVRYGHFNGATSNMVRRTRSPTDFNSGIAVASDWLYYVECLANGGTIEAIPGVWGRYRRHANNVTASNNRSQPFALFEQHLQSCAIILARWPHLARSVRYRLANLLAMQRWQSDGVLYRGYLRASLATRFSFKIAAGLAADLLFGVRR